MQKNSLVEKAKDLARDVHSGQKRVSGDVYFDHLSRVAGLLKELNVEDDVIITASYLHHALDSSNEGKVNQETLKSIFGQEVVDIISDYKALSKGHFSDIDINKIDENLLIQTYFNISKNPKTLLIRMADKVDNIKTAHKLPKDHAQKVAERALYLYAPICKLIGISKFVRLLEDGAFKILNPKEFYKIEHHIRSNFPRINKELEEITKFLTEIFHENDIEADVQTRVKGIYSSYSKLKRYVEKGVISKTSELRGLYDYIGIRILVDNEEECYKCEDLLSNLWTQIPDTRDDYISKPKPNGYRTLQCSYIVSKKTVVEVQIRTHKMHEFNEYGHASHTLYKLGETLKGDFRKNSDFLKNVSYLINQEKFDIGQFSKNVYVYTPKGDIKKLPKGSNLLDFAYTVHKDLGNMAIGGEVNGEFKPLEHILNDGDRVEIKTQKQKKSPSIKYIELVKTAKAREEIRKALRIEEKKILRK